MKKVVVFDVDGTLCDTKGGIIHAFNHVLSAVGKSVIKAGEEAKYIGPPVKQSFVKYHGMNEGDAEKATYMYRKVYVETYVQDSKLYDKVEEVLSALQKNGCKICIATMKTRPQVDRLLEIFQIRDFFDVVQTAKADGSLSKEGMLHNIMEVYGEADYYMIGDTAGDYKASKAVGTRFVAATYGYGDFVNCDPDYEIDRFEGILEVVK